MGWNSYKDDRNGSIEQSGVILYNFGVVFIFRSSSFLYAVILRVPAPISWSFLLPPYIQRQYLLQCSIFPHHSAFFQIFYNWSTLQYFELSNHFMFDFFSASWLLSRWVLSQLLQFWFMRFHMRLEILQFCLKVDFLGKYNLKSITEFRLNSISGGRLAKPKCGQQVWECSGPSQPCPWTQCSL